LISKHNSVFEQYRISSFEEEQHAPKSFLDDQSLDTEIFFAFAIKFFSNTVSTKQRIVRTTITHNQLQIR
jgi:hypothetical protein